MKKSKNITYRIFKVNLPARDIFNCLEVEENYRNKKNEKNKFYDKLEESVLEHGFRNPILIISGFCPPIHMRRLPLQMRQNVKSILICAKLGGSRLWVAQKHNMNIPCIVSDFVNRFEGHKELYTEDDVINEFTDKPKWCIFSHYGVMTSQLQHVHLK
ncbi:MAG: hypothetical protein WC284_10225 [Candidimonas sp.]